MKRISPAQYAQALAKQQSFTDAQWLKRCDELAVQQPVPFFELLTFARDGLPEKIFRSLIDYLSILQFACTTVSESAATPISMPEFQAAIKRMMQFFHALTTDDRPHFDRMMKSWYDGVMGTSEPVVWAGCMETLNNPEIMDHALYKGIVITISGIADVYASRLAGQSPEPKSPRKHTSQSRGRG